jgi:hypothetical protein
MTIYFWRFETPDLTPEIGFEFLLQTFVRMDLRGKKKNPISGIYF